MWGWNLHPVSEVRSIDGTVTHGRRWGGGNISVHDCPFHEMPAH